MLRVGQELNANGGIFFSKLKSARSWITSSIGCNRALEQRNHVQSPHLEPVGPIERVHRLVDACLTATIS